MLGLKSLIPSADPWPLKFRWHNFGARCHNTLRCSVVYNRFQFASDKAVHGPSGQPVHPDWKDDWSAGYIVGKGFAPPVEVDWISMDGREHHAQVDLAEIFRDRMVRHNVPKGDIPEGWLAAKTVNPVSVDILMEVNDRTISVYMRAHITTKEPQIPGNPRSCHRRDLIQVWTHIY